MPDIRICNLCGVIARTATLLPCSHVLCKVCYGQVKEKNQSCPVDRKKIIEEQVQTLELKEDQLDDRRVLCLNSRRGCSFMGNIADFKEHIEKDCDYHEVSCPKCGSSVPQMKILEHCLGSCVEGTISVIPNENGSVLGDLRKIRQSLDGAVERMSQKKVAVQDKVNGLVECLDGYASEIKSLQDLLRGAIASSQLARVHIPPAVADGKRSGCAVGGTVVDRAYVCLGEIYKRKSSLCGGASKRDISPVCILAGYSLMVESKFAERDEILHLELGVMFGAGSWDSFVSWPFSRQVTLTLVHPADERKNISLPVSVPEDTERFECVKKPSPEGFNAVMRTRPVTWKQLELSGFIANDSLCISVEIE